MSARTAVDVEKQRAEADVRRAVTSILSRGGDRDIQALEIHQAYTGRFDLRPNRVTSEYCPIHPSIRNPCGLCPPPAPPGDDDDD